MNSLGFCFLAVFFSQALANPTKLIHQIFKHKSSQNIIFSPLSIVSCLTLTYIHEHSYGNEVLKTALQLNDDSKETIAKNFNENLQKNRLGKATIKANSIYLDFIHIGTDFEHLAEKPKIAVVSNRSQDEALDPLNVWVKKQTENKIESLVYKLDPLTVWMFINTIYFKAEWTKKFDRRNTKSYMFKISETNQINVEMMSQTGRFRFGKLPDLQSTAFEMSYAGTDLTMLVILPNAINGLSALESKLKRIDLIKISENLREEEVNLKLLKFKMEFDISTLPVLNKLGIKTLMALGFEPSEEVSHKAIIEVDEDGTEAVAVTDYIMCGPPCDYIRPPSPVHDFVADHPFLFAIKDKRTVYFVGHIGKFREIAK